jgi:serine/threonine protein kinase
MSQLQFVIVSGPDKDRRLTLQEGLGHMLGRHQDAAYRLNDPRASRQHCEVRCDGDQVTLVDKGSSSGTFVNGTRITQRLLKLGDTIRVGETELRLQLEDLAGATTVTGTGPKRVADQDARASEELTELVGCKLGHYEIGMVLGNGASALVFRANDASAGKEVALKVLQASFSKNEDEMQRFIRAMKTMLPLRHPHLVTLHAAGKTGPYCWIAMELVEGESLTQVIRRIGVAGMLDWKHAFRVALHVARALDYAHGQGIIHRGVSPANILVRSEDKVVKLGDLMLAKALEGVHAQEITRPGELVGVVNYMSPERTRGQSEKIDGRTDLFSLGATIYALLTGKPPFAGSSLVETINKIRTAEPVKPTKFQMSIPGLFEGVVLRMLAKAPEHRYQTAAEVVTELERIGVFQGVKA